MTNQLQIKPLYLFSLPRAGSTLIQRLLSRNPSISTASEPWLLLPYLYANKGDGHYAEYAQNLAAVGIEDFCKQLPNGNADYDAALREFVVRLYSMVASPDSIYFLDKTPRYHCIADQILDLFPEGKAIILWRNPLAVAASMMETWSNGYWKLYTYKFDLYSGLANLVRLHEQCGDRVYALQYEKLVADTSGCLTEIYRYLELAISSDDLVDLDKGAKLHGRMGDPTGIHAYDKVSPDSLDKWKVLMGNPLRKFWCRRYLSWIGAERLAVMGYDKDELFKQVSDIPFTLRYLFTDCFRMLGGIFYSFFEPVIFRDKLKKLIRHQPINAHR